MKGDIELKVHPLFFREFASKTWVSITGIVSELVENSFDEDATKVLISILDDGSIIVEDNAGMNKDSLDKFLFVGSPHKQDEQRSPQFNRIRSGKYGTGRLSFLTAFNRMDIKTKSGKFSISFQLNEHILEKLSSGKVELTIVDEHSLNRNGTEIRLLEPKMTVDIHRIKREMTRLDCLRQPFFELYIKRAQTRNEWSFTEAEKINPPQFEGIHIPITEEGLEGEILVTKRPLPEDERGLAIMVGGHIVGRNNFGVLGASADRISGWVRGQHLTSRFADKSALVEDHAYEKFGKQVRNFLKEKVLPIMAGYVEVEITKEESRVYKKVDQLLADAVHHIIKSEIDSDMLSTEVTGETSLVDKIKDGENIHSSFNDNNLRGNQLLPKEDSEELSLGRINENQNNLDIISSNIIKNQNNQKIRNKDHIISPEKSITPINQQSVETQKDFSEQSDTKGISSLRKQKRVIRRTFVLKKVGYRVIPYEDEQDEKEAFTEELTIYVNKVHPTYRAEAQKGGELLIRHVIRLVSKIIALNHHPEGKDALELQNKLIAEAIRLRQIKPPRTFTNQRSDSLNKNR